MSTTITCPACQQSMTEFKGENLTYEVCGGCQGMWFDFGELKSGIMLESAKSLNPATLEKGDDVSDHEHEYKCAKCDTSMEEREYASDSGIHIDACPSCKGIFVSTADMAELRSFLHSRENSSEMKDLQAAAGQALSLEKTKILERQATLAKEIDDLHFMDDLPGINRVTEWLIDELVDTEAWDI